MNFVRIANVLLALVLFCSLILFESCQELPEASQTGRGIFGMKIDGKIWKGDGAIAFPPSATAIYYSKHKGLRIEVVVDRQNKTQERFNIAIENIQFQGIYQMGNLPFRNSNYDSTMFWFNDDEWLAYKLRQGVANSVEITRFDTLREIISGTFSVSLVNRKNDTLKLTDGRFDLSFITNK